MTNSSSAVNLIIYILSVAGGFAGLYYGASWLVRGSSDVARRMGVSSLVIGLTLVACGTSTPELVVSINSAVTGHVDISLGNIVGSNICNIALILGLSSLITPLAVNKNILKYDTPVMIMASVLLALFYFLSVGINRMEAFIMLVIFIAYVTFTVCRAKRSGAELPEEAGKDMPAKMLSVPLALLLALAGLGILVGASELFVYGAVGIASWLNVSQAVIGLTVVAVGTSLPELATSVTAAVKGERDIAIGNVVGSNIFNILGILGIAPLFQPLLNSQISMFDMGTMLFLAIILLPLMMTERRINRWEGALLLVLYGAYLAVIARNAAA